MNANSNNLSEVRLPHVSRKLARVAALILLGGSYLLPSLTMACGTSTPAKPVHPGQSKQVVVSQAKKATSPIDLDYFQSMDNPMRAD